MILPATPLVPGHITSNEPGYYKVNSFGIRLESVIGVKEVETRYNEGDKGWLGFERFTMVFCFSLYFFQIYPGSKGRELTCLNCVGSNSNEFHGSEIDE